MGWTVVVIVVVLALIAARVAWLWNDVSSQLHRVDALSGAADTPGETWLIVGSDARGGVIQDDTEGARADAVPNLEIETGEIIGAGHAATVGRFDDEQEFYLRARGIPPEEARRLIVRGFFSEVIGRIPVAAIREDLENRVAAELEALQQHA